MSRNGHHSSIDEDRSSGKRKSDLGSNRDSRDRERDRDRDRDRNNRDNRDDDDYEDRKRVRRDYDRGDRDYRDRERDRRDKYDDRDRRDRDRDRDYRDKRDGGDRNNRDSRDRSRSRSKDRSNNRDSRDRNNNRDSRDINNRNSRDRHTSKENHNNNSESTNSNGHSNTNSNNVSPILQKENIQTPPQPVTASSTQTPTTATAQQNTDTAAQAKADRIAELKARVAARKNEIKKDEIALAVTTPAINNVAAANINISPTVSSPITPTTTTTTTTAETAVDKEQKIKDEDEESSSMFFDPRLTKGTKKKKTFDALTIVKPGKYTKKAEQFRIKQLQEEISKRELITSTILDLKPIYKLDDVPLVEWWDQDLLSKDEKLTLENNNSNNNNKEKNKEDTEMEDINKDSITDTVIYERLNPENVNELLDTDDWSYIEHPVQIAAPADNGPPVVLHIIPPLKERKRLKKIRRREFQRERQERILDGREAPPPNKVKLSNLMRVLTTQAVLDPTQITATVKAQMEASLKAHTMRNHERMLTPEQRKEKNQQKLAVDNQREMRCALFKVHDLSHPLHRATIFKFARQSVSTGCALINSTFSLVVVEAGNKSMKKFKKLLTHRIKWQDAPPIIVEENPEENPIEVPKPKDLSQPNYCQLIWEGPIETSHFKKFEIQICQTESLARKYLQEHNIPHFWEMAKSHINSQY